MKVIFNTKIKIYYFSKIPMKFNIRLDLLMNNISVNKMITLKIFMANIFSIILHKTDTVWKINWLIKEKNKTNKKMIKDFNTFITRQLNPDIVKNNKIIIKEKS